MMSLLCVTLISLTLASSVHCEAQGTPSTLAAKVYANLSSNVTLPCRLQHSLGLMSFGIRVKWTKVVEDESLEEDVLVSMGFHKKSYGSFENRVFLQEADDEDASLVITDVSIEDMGKYHCEVINGVVDAIQEVTLEVLGSAGLSDVDLSVDHSDTGVDLSVDHSDTGVDLSVDQSDAGVMDLSVEHSDAGVMDLSVDNSDAGVMDLSVEHSDAGVMDLSVDRSDASVMDLSVDHPDASVDFSVDHSDTGVVFPYSPRLGRYNLNFHDAEQACLEQDAVVASFDQLYEAWRSGLDWCNAGWLNDGTVQYPITNPRGPCGGSNVGAGLRNYGQRDKTSSRFDVFCFASALNGSFYWLVQPDRLTYDEAVQACLFDGAEIAKVGHMFAAWKLQGYDRCDAGWLADASVRYPISRPRKNCSPTEPAVRFVGFPDKKQKLYGVYCYKAQQ